MGRRGRFGRISSGTMISRPTMAWLPITKGTRCSPGLRRQAPSRLEIDLDYWKVPMRVKNLEPPLLLALKCLLVGEKLFLHSVLVDGINGRGGALEDQRDAIVPPAVLGGVVPRFDRGDFQYPPVRRQFLENGEMVLLEQANELVRLSPPDLVVSSFPERRAVLWAPAQQPSIARTRTSSPLPAGSERGCPDLEPN